MKRIFFCVCILHDGNEREAPRGGVIINARLSEQNEEKLFKKRFLSFIFLLLAWRERIVKLLIMVKGKRFLIEKMLKRF